MSADTTPKPTRDPLALNIRLPASFRGTVRLPYNAKRDEERRENLVANRGVQSVPTWGGPKR